LAIHGLADAFALVHPPAEEIAADAAAVSFGEVDEVTQAVALKVRETTIIYRIRLPPLWQSLADGKVQRG